MNDRPQVPHFWSHVDEHEIPTMQLPLATERVKTPDQARRLAEAVQHHSKVLNARAESEFARDYDRELAYILLDVSAALGDLARDLDYRIDRQTRRFAESIERETGELS